jgi:hypothetical protein
MADPTNVVNPGSVNVADEAFDGLPSQVPQIGSTPASASPTNVQATGPLAPVVVDQEILVGPTQVHRLNLDGGVGGTPATTIDQEILVGPAQTAGANVNGGTFSPQSPNTQNTSQNNVVGQVFGSGTPTNVFV